MASGSTASSPSAAGTRRSFGSGSRVGVLLGQPLIRELSTRLNAAGIGYFKFNNRGHDVVTGRGRHLAGAAFERFGQSVEDIRAMIGFAATCGYRRVILAGHSTGANKVLHYAARTRDRRVTALV